MNPKYRRLLIPGLLIALLIVVVVASLAGKSEAAEAKPVAVLSDSRITESSGLAVSSEHADLAYTVNDSGSASQVFAIDLKSGNTVAVIDVKADFVDVEALAVGHQKLWIADVGDNSAVRNDTSLYVIDEPGPRTQRVTPKRYRVALAHGPEDVETLLVDPNSEALYLVTKGLLNGRVMQASRPDLRSSQMVTFRQVADTAPGLVTDGAYSPNGQQVALLTYYGLTTMNPNNWEVVGSQSLPALAQAETVDFISNKSVLVGSEGKNSPLYKLKLAPVAEAQGGPETVATGSVQTPDASAGLPSEPVEPTARNRESTKSAGVGLWPLSLAVLAVSAVAFAARALRRR